jgi:hypothetical protein
MEKEVGKVEKHIKHSVTINHTSTGKRSSWTGVETWGWTREETVAEAIRFDRATLESLEAEYGVAE